MEIQPNEGQLYQTGPATQPVSNYVHDLIQCMSEKLDSVWRYDQYMKDCQGENCKTVFQQCKDDDLKNIKALRDEISNLCSQGKFK